MTLATILLAAGAAAADLTVEITSDDGAVTIRETWPAVETLSKKFGPFEVKGAQTAWSLTAQPSVFDALSGTYELQLTTCVRWTKGSKADEHCEKFEGGVGASGGTFAEREWKGKGLKVAFVVTASYAGDTPRVGLPEPEPRPIPGE
jgi:hypothetical protein